jgi:fatty-acid desaturase
VVPLGDESPLDTVSGEAASFAWVADHRRHHAFSDKEGDPHSPWLFGTGPGALAKGFWHSHMGWLFDRDLTNEQRYTPDLLADRDLTRVDRLFGLWSVATLLVPAALGGLLSWSWWGALTTSSKIPTCVMCISSRRPCPDRTNRSNHALAGALGFGGRVSEARKAAVTP